MPEVVRAVRNNGGVYTLNIAHADHVETVQVGPVEIYDPALEADRRQLIAAIQSAQELGTAVPSVNFFASATPGSIHRLLAAGLAATPKRYRAVYTAENHNHAAEILQAQVYSLLGAETQERVSQHTCFTNTVVAKMSGIQPATQHLPPIAPGLLRAFLVEAFNHIQISQIAFPGQGRTAAVFQRGLSIFEEKVDLLPFEEAKLYMLNGMHAMSAYLGALQGLHTMSELVQRPAILQFVQQAGIEETGVALQRKYAGRDPLFTTQGIADYVQECVRRMLNPYLSDAIERVGRDPERKLGWNDRLIGAMRLCLSYDIAPHRYGVGAAAALKAWNATTQNFPADDLHNLWTQDTHDRQMIARVLDFVRQGWQTL
jgi:mannitol-1-phosphate 5-dehydrogenase